MSTEANKAIYRRWIEEGFNHKNPAIFDELFDPGFVERTPQQPGQAPGIEGLKQSFSMMWQAFPDAQVNIEELIAEGNKVVARVRASGTHQGEFQGMPPTHKRMTISGMDLIGLQGGRIVEHWGEWDNLGLLQQIGALPARS